MEYLGQEFECNSRPSLNTDGGKKQTPPGGVGKGEFFNKYVLINFQLHEKVRLDFNFPFDCIEAALYGLECFQYFFVFREIAKHQVSKRSVISLF